MWPPRSPPCTRDRGPTQAIRGTILFRFRPLPLALLIAALTAALTASVLFAAEAEPTPVYGEDAAAIEAERDSLAQRNAALRSQILKERKVARSRVSKARKIADVRVQRAVDASPVGTSSEEAVRLAAIAYGLPEERMLAIARCESTLNPSASSGPYLGLFQFGTPLWGTTPYAAYGRDNAQAAALAASWAFARGMDSHWPVCGKN